MIMAIRTNLFVADLRSAFVIIYVFVASLVLLSIFAPPTQVQGYDVDSVCDICSFYAGDLAPGKILVGFYCIYVYNSCSNHSLLRVYIFILILHIIMP